MEHPLLFPGIEDQKQQTKFAPLIDYRYGLNEYMGLHFHYFWGVLHCATIPETAEHAINTQD